MIITMNNLVVFENDEIIKKTLYPMMQLLDEKNIISGMTIIKENQSIYICFDKNCLSDSNQLILEKISCVYSETFFHSDNKQSPNLG